MKLVKNVAAFFSIVWAIGKIFHARVISPENDGKSLPPIRYDGDVTDIYLA